MEFPLHQMEIGMADGAGPNAKEDLAWAGIRHRQVLLMQW